MTHEMIDDREVVHAASALRAGEAGASTEAIARAAWSVLAEPGDGVAGSLIRELGAAGALELALDAPSLADGRVDGSARAHRALAEGRARWRPRAQTRALVDALHGASQVGARLVLPGDPDWPDSLDDLGEHAPPALWVRGDARLLRATPRVAIVGARAATGYGEHIAAEIAGDLAAGGATVVSGGAYGIDGVAHRAALGVRGATIAFLAGGVDRAYPSGHQELFTRIAGHGAVVSELPCGAAPTKWRFLARNRLIAALGQATVVVEAGWRSGSLNTAGHAAALGRPLGAVPGPVTSAASAGCHRLLREYDARCVTCAAEVRELWGDDTQEASASRRQDPDRTRLLDALGTRTPLDVMEICRRSGLAPDRVRALLGLLDLEGILTRSDAGWVRAANR
ncbi:DNA-processing protein DprA [Microbacterium galbinum]|uniref:DNA-processing protein DprA n=1 Tax=Microbacterium galbinum TaxID=2851646 RepID=UPI001FFD873B|nr:DNA-processing protein DprA [Microbacterium galbinum]